MSKTYFKKVPRAQVLLVKKSSLASAFKKIKADWDKHLAGAHIKLPKPNTAKWYQLTTLKHFEKRAVHKDDVAALIAKLTGAAATDQQIRHLKTQGGWHILNRGDSFVVGKTEHWTPEGCHVLITTKTPLSHATIERRAVVSAGDWQAILKAYDNTCASCGTKIGEYHRFDKSFKVTILEKGHMNPRKPLAAGNLIPQCRWCNKTARGDFTFDEQGRPKAVASTRPVRRADSEVIAEIKAWVGKTKSPASKKRP